MDENSTPGEELAAEPPGSGLFASILEDAGEVEIWLHAPTQTGVKNLGKCTVIGAERDAALVRNATGVLLIPSSSIAYVRLSWNEQYIQDWRRTMRPRQIRFGG